MLVYGDREQSVLHLYNTTKRRKWRTQRRVLQKNLHNIGGIRWQKPTRKKVVSRAASKITGTVGPLLSYLKDTEVGSREGAAEVTRGWMQRNDQEGEEQLGNC